MGTAACVTLCLSALSANPSQDVVRDRVDLVEVNHFFDEQGHLVFDQVIYYDWHASQGRFNVRAWRLLKTPAQRPRRNWSDGTWEAIWHDGGVLRKVKASTYRESWTQFDPELVERAFLAKGQRRELQFAGPPR